MTAHPPVFKEEAYRASLLQQGCNPKYIDAYVSDYTLLVPLVLSAIGEDQFREIASHRLNELGMSASYTPQSAKYIVNWMTVEVEKFASAKRSSSKDTASG